MLKLLEKQQRPEQEKITMLVAILKKFNLDLQAIFALIDAFNYGVIEGKRIERRK